MKDKKINKLEKALKDIQSQIDELKKEESKLDSGVEITVEELKEICDNIK